MNLLHRHYSYTTIFACILFFFSFCAAYKRQLKILQVVPTFPKIHDICMLNQIKGLIDHGHDVTIYAPRLGDMNNIQEDVITYNLLSKTIISPELPKDLDKYDIVVFQLGHKAENIKKTRNFRGKVVVCLRGYDITGFVKNNVHAYDELFDGCDLFMPVCKAFQRRLERLGCDPKKILVHHSGIDTQRFYFKQRILPQGRINILSAGRFVEKKGFQYSITAIAKLIQKYPQLRYTIIGDGELKKKYLRLIKKLGMTGKITLVNWYPHDKYIAVLDRSHIFIAPSITARDNDQEGIPNVLKEAMAMGLLVIATHHSGNNELIEDNVSGFLVPERNSDAIVNKIEYILNNPQEWQTIQSKARAVVEDEFDTAKVNDELAAIFLHLVNND